MICFGEWIFLVLKLQEGHLQGNSCKASHLVQDLSVLWTTHNTSHSEQSLFEVKGVLLIFLRKPIHRDRCSCFSSVLFWINLELHYHINIYLKDKIILWHKKHMGTPYRLISSCWQCVNPLAVSQAAVQISQFCIIWQVAQNASGTWHLFEHVNSPQGNRTAEIVIITGCFTCDHYTDVIMGAMATQITSLTIVYSGVYSGADQRKHQSSASLAFVRGIHRWPVNFPRKWPVMRDFFIMDSKIG